MKKILEKSKKSLSAFPVFVLLFSLSGCSGNNSANTETGLNNQNNQDSATITQTAAEKTLKITDYRCNGCGRCTQIDPEHFVFNNNIRKAEVISTQNLNSQNLTMAVSVCRERAIELS